MLYGVSNKSTPQEIASTYLRNHKGWLHRPLQASYFIATMKEIIKKARELRKVEEAISVFGAEKVNQIRGCCCRPKFRQTRIIKAEIQELNKLVEKYRAMDDAAGEFQEQNVVFATMEDPRHAKQLLKVWRRCKCVKVTGVRAPPPKDVFWENLHQNTFSLQILFIILTVLFAAGVGVGLFFVQEWQKNTGSSEILLGLLISLIIFFADKTSQYFLKIFTRLERHHSLTQAQINFASKLVVFNSLFSIFLPLFVFRESSQQQTGLLQEVLLSLVIFSFLGPLAYSINPFFIYRQIRYSCLKSSLKRKRNTFMTLKEAEKLAELDNFQFAKRYAETLIPLFLAAFYLAFFPLGAVIAGAGSYFNHILTVCQWSTINRRPAPLSPRIAKHFFDALVLFPILVLLGSIVAFSIIPGFRPQIHIFLMLVFCGVFILLIFVAYKCISNQLLNGSRFYKPCARWFVTYFHCNPDGFQRNSTDLAQTDGISSTEQPASQRNQKRLKFDPKDYWESRNNYPFQDPIYNQKAVVQMLKNQREEEENKDLLSSIDNELRATQSQGFFGAALKQLNRTLYAREQNKF